MANDAVVMRKRYSFSFYIYPQVNFWEIELTHAVTHTVFCIYQNINLNLHFIYREKNIKELAKGHTTIFIYRFMLGVRMALASWVWIRLSHTLPSQSWWRAWLANRWSRWPVAPVTHSPSLQVRVLCPLGFMKEFY